MDKQVAHGVLERLSLLHSSSKWYDIEFHLTDPITGKTFVAKAHRILLASCSPVFEALCFGPLAESNKVEVPDIHPAAFRTLLKYLYTDTVEFHSVEVVSSLYYAGKKYLIHSICDIAKEYLLEKIDERNCVDLFNLASVFEDKEFVDEVWDYIRGHLNYIEKSSHRDSLSLEFIKRLVNDDVLDADELLLASLAQMWAEEYCINCNLDITHSNIRNVLNQNNIFQKIRWSLLNNDDLTKLLPGLLTENESMILTGPSCNNLELKRRKPPIKYVYIHRFPEDITRDVGIDIIPDSLIVNTQIVVNRSIVLHGIYVSSRELPAVYSTQFNSRNLSYKEDMFLKVVQCDSGEAVCSKKVSDEVPYNSSFIVKLDKPLLLKAGSSHVISINLLHAARSYGFRRRNLVGKSPFGLTVSFNESANLFNSGNFIPTPSLSVLTGLELSR